MSSEANGLFDSALEISARGSRAGIRYDSKMAAKVDMREFVDYCRSKGIYCKPRFSKMRVEFAAGSGRCWISFLPFPKDSERVKNFNGTIIEWW